MTFLENEIIECVIFCGSEYGMYALFLAELKVRTELVGKIYFLT